MNDNLPGLGLFPPENPHEFLSDEALTDLPQEEQVEALCDWFRWNYEDPVEETPWDGEDKTYVYIWGGPYDAKEELYGRFDGVVDEVAIEAAAGAIQSDGTWEWAPAGRRVRPEDEVEDDKVDGSTFDEAVIREKVRQSLDDLEHAAEQLRPVRSLIGHNNPPEPIIDVPYTIDDEQSVQAVTRNVREQLEVEGELPVENLITRRRTLMELWDKIGAWIAQKTNLAADEAAKSFGKTIGNLAATGVSAALGAAIYNFWAVLQTAAKTIGEWISYIQLPF